jgi:hypothetical protein
MVDLLAIVADSLLRLRAEGRHDDKFRPVHVRLITKSARLSRLLGKVSAVTSRPGVPIVSSR